MALDGEGTGVMFRKAIYRIRVVGRLGPEWSDLFEGMTLSYEPMEGFGIITEIEASLPDQAALMGVLEQLYDRLIPVVSVTCLAD